VAEDLGDGRLEAREKAFQIDVQIWGKYLDQTIVPNERHLRRVLTEYVRYYQSSRTHLGLAEDCPDSRRVEPPRLGMIQAEPKVGGLHHRYFCCAT
jgi:hypothetical protein